MLLEPERLRPMDSEKQHQIWRLVGDYGRACEHHGAMKQIAKHSPGTHDSAVHSARAEVFAAMARLLVGIMEKDGFHEVAPSDEVRLPLANAA